MSAVRTTCPYCGVGCGVIASTDDEGAVSVRGDPDHPANRGRLCSKGSALAETLVPDGRLLAPVVFGQVTDWDAALQRVATTFAQTVAEHGPDSVAFYVSGQLTTEAYYVANKLMKGFIGSANIDTNSRLCMASAVAAHKRAFGADAVPCSYEDLDQADLVVLAGSNAAWCHPVLFQRLLARRRRGEGPELVVIDPRATDSSRQSDLHLALRPGTDATLFNGLLVWLADQDALDQRFVAEHTEGFEAALASARRSAATPEAVAAECDLALQDVLRFYGRFANTARTVTLFSQGINQSSSGTDKANAIVNVHLASGRIGQPGMGPFSITGQPNAMGGREVGGLANQLAAHMDLADPAARARVQRFWQAPAMAARDGHKAVELFRAVHRGDVKALWIMATNPVDTLPDADFVRAALQRCEFVVVSDCIHPTDTSRHAHVLLPATTWGERDGTVTNSDRTISRQRPFLQPPGVARDDWWIITQVARRMGFGASFGYQTAFDVFAEHALLSVFENQGERAFDLGALATLDEPAYQQLAPIQWPVSREGKGTPRLFGDGRFYTPSGRARFIAVQPKLPAACLSPDFPLALNTGRVRDHWHTMTRTGRAARLSAHLDEPFAEMHPQDAQRVGVNEGDVVRIRSAGGSLLARARVATGQRPGGVFVPMHWNDGFAANARVGALIHPTVDPVSGQPESKFTPVRVEAEPMAWWALVLSRQELALQSDYWVKVREAPDLWRYVVAGREPVSDWSALARRWFCQDVASGDWVEYVDGAEGRYRAARLRQGRLHDALFVQAGALPAGREHLRTLFERGVLSAQERFGLLAGRTVEVSAGPRVCACMGVSRATIEQAIADGCSDVDSVGKTCGAGTQCGSCVPEIEQLLAAALAGEGERAARGRVEASE